MPKHRPPRVFISAAEPSADLHAASLMNAFREMHPDAEFVGIAGPKMQAAGCRAIDNLCDKSAMLLSVAGSLWRAPGLLRRLNETLRPQSFDAAVFIDSPFLHLKLTGLLRSRKIPLLYYVAPQVWAWNESRWKRIKAQVDKLAVILPFEEAYFRAKGIDATYVGHPQFDALAKRSPSAERIAELRASGDPVLAIFPGSRKHEVVDIFADQLRVAQDVRKRFPNVHLLVSLANDRVAPLVRNGVAKLDLPVTLLRDENAEMLLAADLALVTSGTMTLEVAYYHTPMIVMYQHAPLGRTITDLGRKWIIKLKHLSLVNILADRELVPEFMPNYRSTRPIAERAIELLSTPQSLAKMRRELDELMTPIVKTGASENTAKLLDEMIREKSVRR